MTLVIAAPGSDFIVLGADSRGTIQDAAGMSVAINVVQKLVPITKHVAILLFGDADEGTSLVEKFKLNLAKDVDGVSDVAERLANFCRDEFKKLEHVPLTRLPDFGFIVAGLDPVGNDYKIPRCYRLRSTSGFLVGLAKPYAIDGRPFIAYYLFEKHFHEKKTVDDLCQFVAQTIYDSEAIDGAVGGTIKMGIIETSGFREVTAEVRGYIDSWVPSNINGVR